MNLKDFVNMFGLTKTDTVVVNAIELQDTLKELEAYKVEVDRLKNINQELVKENVELEYNLKKTFAVGRTNSKLLKENEELKYKLGLSNMFLERRREREMYNSYKEPLKVDLRV